MKVEIQINLAIITLKSQFQKTLSRSETSGSTLPDTPDTPDIA